MDQKIAHCCLKVDLSVVIYTLLKRCQTWSTICLCKMMSILKVILNGFTLGLITRKQEAQFASTS